MDELVLVPGAVLEVLLATQAPWGYLAFTDDDSEHLSVVSHYSAEDGPRYPINAGFFADHYTFRYGNEVWRGVWYRVPTEINDATGPQLRRQESAISTQFLEDAVQGWRQPPVGAAMVVITIADGDEGPSALAWAVSRQGAQPLATTVVPEDPDPTGLLRSGWPIGDITSRLFTIIGLGSLGSAAADAIAAYGAHRFAFVDPDRLLHHNLVRHRAARRLLGKYKVHAVRETLLAQRPYLDIATFTTSVVDDADRMRPLFRSSSIVVCCADGIQARTVCSHLARGANVPIVLACVLDDGAFGEIIRLRPSRRVGCLQCQRAQARDAGHIDPEPGLELPYGTGDSHRPMTAVGGDLALVGQLAAKVAVATLLEAAGHADQRLAGDHNIVALRPAPDAAYPFDLPRAGDTRWLAAAPPQPDCPTCGCCA